MDIDNIGVLYLRLSKEDVDKTSKEELSKSIENQRLLLMDYALKNDIQIIDVYIDDDYSGLYDNRPGFEQLIRDGKLGKYRIVIAKSQSRFTRNMEHVEKYLHHDFPLLGIRFIGVVDGVDTNIKGNKKARQIYGLTNEWYCEDLSANIRSVYKQKMKAGQFLGSYAPYGYLKDPENRYNFVVDEYAANVVRKIFSLYIQGYSVKKITSILEDKEIPNPTVYKNQQGLSYRNPQSKEFGMKYNFWSTSTITRIIKNETYIGNLVQGMAKRASYKDKKVIQVPEDEWIVIENHHEPIVDLDIFMKAQQLRKKRRIVHKNQSSDKKVHILAGKIRCNTCGSTMIKSGGVRKDLNDSFLRCQLSNKSRLKECTSHAIKLSVVEAAVLEHIQNLVYPVIADPQNKDELIKQIVGTDDSEKQIREKKKHLSIFEEQLINKKKSFQLLYEDRVRGIISDSIFLDLKNDIEREILKLKKKIKQLEDECCDLQNERDTKREVDELIEKYCDFSKLTHEMVVDFIDHVEISEKNTDAKEQEIIIYWNF